MSLVVADRVKETTTVVGTGTATLLGASVGFQSFAAVGNGNVTYYCIAGQGTADWEVGIGTYSTTGPTLTRTTILASSNAGSAVSFPAGTKDIFLTYPAEKSINYNVAGNFQATGQVTLPASTSSLVPLHFTVGTQPTAPAQGDTWSESSGVYFKNSLYTEQLNIGANNAGTLAMPAITVTGGGATISAGSVEAVLFSLPGWSGDYKTYTIPAATGLALVDNSANYLIVSYNSGSPVYSITQNVTVIDNSSIVGAALLWRNGADVHYQPIDWGLSTASRLNRRLVQTNRYQWASGLALGESTGRVITLSAGVVWYGVTQYNELAQTSASSNAEFWFHSSGNWTSSLVSTYNNTQYDDGTNLVTLSNGRYAVNWVYRYIDGSGLPKLAYILGLGNYTLAQAVASLSPTPPPVLSTMAILVGRVIVLKSAVTATQIDSAFTQVFSGTTVTNHNDLANLQGGTTDEYYHLTNAEYTGTGTGVFVRKTSPAITTPAITGGTATGIAISASSTVDGSIIGGTTPAAVTGTVVTGATLVASNGLVVNSKTVSASYTIPVGSSAMSTGPITIASGQAVTVSAGSRWIVL